MHSLLIVTIQRMQHQGATVGVTTQDRHDKLNNESNELLPTKSSIHNITQHMFDDLLIASRKSKYHDNAAWS